MGDKLPLAGRFFPPTEDAIADIRDELRAYFSEKQRGQKEIGARLRAEAGLSILELIRAPGVSDKSGTNLAMLYGEKEWKKVLGNIVTNSYSIDLHFLPADEQPAEWSVIHTHSVALLRYPMVAPVELFECAQDLSLKSWDDVINRMVPVMPTVKSFALCRPMRRAILQPRFLGDLVTRFVAMHVRLGSPDFPKATVADYINEIGVQQ